MSIISKFYLCSLLTYIEGNSKILKNLMGKIDYVIIKF